MRISLENLMEKLGVGRILTPYEAEPWLLYDEDRGITCSAEVRVGPGYEDIETEIQFLFDEYDEGVIDMDATDEEDGGQQGEGGGMHGMPPGKPKSRNIIVNGRQQIMLMRIKPSFEDSWTPTNLIVKGVDYYNLFPKWDEKGCEFFRSAIEALQMGELPDFDELIESQLIDDSEWGSGRRGRIGRKSPKANPAALLGMKK
jgi:hypothetical protein